MEAVSWLDVGIIIAYLMGMIGVGVWSLKKVKSLGDYSLAQGSLGYPVMIGTLVGACIGAASTFGKAGKAYQVGSFLFFATLGYSIGLAWFGRFSRRLREEKIWTIPEVIRKRYGLGMELSMGGVMLIAVIAVFGGQIIGMGAIFTAVGKSFGLTYTSAIIIAAGVIIFYTLVGGMYAVAYTDLIQSAIMILGIGIILPAFILTAAAGKGDFWVMLRPPSGNLLGGMSPLYVVSIFLIDIPFCLVDPSLWQRSQAAKSDRVIQGSALVSAGIYTYWSLICVGLGVLGAVLIPNVAERFGSSDAIIPALTIRYLPSGLVGFCLAGMMAVMMSTASVALLITGTTLSNDLVRPLRPGISEKALIYSARITVLAVGVLGVIFALWIKNLFDLLLLAFAVYVSGVFFPVMAALYWDKATRAGAMVSSVAASIIVIALYALNKPWNIEPIMVSLTVSAVLMAAVSLATYTPETATPRILRRKSAERNCPAAMGKG